MTHKYRIQTLPSGYLAREIPLLPDPDSFVLYEVDSGGPYQTTYVVARAGWNGGGNLPALPWPTVGEAMADFKRRAAIALSQAR